MNSKTMKSFIKEVKARIEGDGAEAQAQKNYRKASSSVNASIASLKATLVDEENALEDAQDLLKKAKYPATEITDGKSFLSSIRYAQEQLETAQSKVDATKASIAFWETFSAEMDTEV
jgi:hypothetical protein